MDEKVKALTDNAKEEFRASIHDPRQYCVFLPFPIVWELI